VTYFFYNFVSDRPEFLRLDPNSKYGFLVAMGRTFEHTSLKRF